MLDQHGKQVWKVKSTPQAQCGYEVQAKLHPHDRFSYEKKEDLDARDSHHLQHSRRGFGASHYELFSNGT